jgi:hypothetical protein
MRALRSRAAAVAILFAAAALAGPFTSGAVSEVVQKGGVRVSVAGGIAPKSLPRRGSAPVSVSLAGHIAPIKKGQLPKLESISVAINSNGTLNNRRVPTCRLGHISPSTNTQALTACRSSLVGEGHFSADVKIPEQSPFPSEGKVLAFNGKYKGHPAIFAHIYGTKPVPTSYVLPFVITSTHGTYGTILEASLPRVTGEWGYVTGVSLDLDPSYLSAGCPAPAGFNSAVFPLMRASFGFDGGLRLVSTLNRNCQVSK